jgi:hypothetical protein
VWGPHGSERRGDKKQGVFGPYRRCIHIRSDSGPRHSEDVENDKDQVEKNYNGKFQNR